MLNIFSWHILSSYYIIKNDDDEYLCVQCRSVDASTLRDPQTDDERVKDPEWLVILGRSLLFTFDESLPVVDIGLAHLPVI